MDLEVVGRHALLFDEDSMAAFVNSAAALVDWNSLSIDRYDVRHLLSDPPPPRNRRRRHHSASPNREDNVLESELDHERYLDLASPSEEEQDLGNEEESENPSGYNAVAFSYGTGSGSNVQKDTDAESSFRPSFSVPEHLLQHLPPTEKLHQIIARTAVFVRKHGGQSEIVLRVKQGDNPTFGFLLPEHNLHPYFRFLVKHNDILKSDITGKPTEENRIDSGLDQMGGVGGALSLLGSVYGSGEDEEAATEDAPALTENETEVAVNADDVTVSNGSEEKNSSNVPGKDDILSRPSFPALKERSHVIKRNCSISGVKSVSTTGGKKDGDSMDTVSSTVDKLQPSVSSKVSKVEQLILEPPTDMKRVIDKIVEFILRNGKEFEAVLVQQDTKHGRFPFLLPSNQFHPYYLNILQKAQESRSSGKSFISDKHASLGYGTDKKTGSRENDTHSLSSDIPYEPDRKEKFKMVLGKSKKDGQDPPSKANPQPVGVSIDAAAAILQAARKGIKNPNLELLCKTMTGSGQVHSGEGGDSQISFWAQSSNNQNKNGDSGVSVPVAKAIAKTAAAAAANEADSSEASFSREKKLKAERLKRAKMFAAMVKSGAAPLKSEPLRGLSVEPSESGFSGSDSQVHLARQERESSSVPLDVDSNGKIEKPETKQSEEQNERRLKRSYRSRTKRVEEEEEDGEEEDSKQSRDHKHSRKKRHRKSHRSKDRHKHRKRHSSTRDLESDEKLDSSSAGEHRHSRHRHDDDISSDDGRGYSRHKRERDSYVEDDGHRHRRRRHRHSSSDDDEPTHSRRTDDEHMRSRHSRRHSDDGDGDGEHRRSHHRHKHDTSSDEEHRRRAKSVKHEKTARPERDPDLEEGEILAKSDQSKASECGNDASREASVDLSKSQPAETTEVSDDLRAKIRAMLMATL